MNTLCKLEILRFLLVKYLIPLDFLSLRTSCKTTLAWKFSSLSLRHWSVDVSFCSSFLKSFKLGSFSVVRRIFPSSMLFIEYSAEKEELYRRNLLSHEILKYIELIEYQVSWNAKKQKYVFCVVRVEVIQAMLGLSPALRFGNYTMIIDPDFFFEVGFTDKMVKNTCPEVKRQILNFHKQHREPFFLVPHLEHDTLHHKTSFQRISFWARANDVEKRLNRDAKRFDTAFPMHMTLDDGGCRAPHLLKSFDSLQTNLRIDTVILRQWSSFDVGVFPFIEKITLDDRQVDESYFYKARQCFPNAKIQWTLGKFYLKKWADYRVSILHPSVEKVVLYNSNRWTANDFLGMQGLILKKLFIHFRHQYITAGDIKRRILFGMNEKKYMDSKMLGACTFQKLKPKFKNGVEDPLEEGNYLIENWKDVPFSSLFRLFFEKTSSDWYIVGGTLFFFHQYEQEGEVYYCQEKQLL